MSAERQQERNAWFAVRILLPVLLAVIATFVVVGGLISYSASKSDEQALERQTALVQYMLDRQSDIVRQQQADVVAWDDAVSAVTDTPDTEWLYRNIGRELFESFGHDLTFILDPGLNPILAVKNGNEIDTRLYGELSPRLGPFVHRLRDIDWQGALAAFNKGTSHVLPSVGDIMLIKGEPAIVNFMPIASEGGQTHYAPGSEYVTVTAQYLDAELAGLVSSQLMLTNARFSTTINAEPGDLSIALTNRAGRTIGYFSWTPDRPGAAILGENVLAFAVALGIVSLIVAGLITGLSRSTSQLEAGREAVQYLAFHDKLTGLANRALFEDRLSLAAASARRGPNQVALLIIDLDRFKQVNDSLGHEAGDELICQVADRLRPLLRDTDTIARLGGDEFAIIQTDVKSISDVSLVADRIIRAISLPFGVASSQAFVGCSIGIALAPSDADSTLDLTRKADIALYEAKAAGRNQFMLFEGSMSEAVQKRQTIEAELRRALRNGTELNVSFAPLIREQTGALVGVSTEISWTHSTLGEVDPDRFLAVAESCGLIEEIGDLMLRRACEKGANEPGIRVSVPVFITQLRNPLFVTRLVSLLDETGMKATDLEIEIGESMLAETETVSRKSLRALRQAGICIALGDFGTGFRSLKLLQKFEVDRIKIDRGFIAQLADSPDPEAITHAVVWLARAIGVEVSADGIDSIEQKTFLSRMGVMSFQGALFSSLGQSEPMNESFKIEHSTAPRVSPRDDIELWG